jgi:phosphoenolpyruvate carboxykinase (GTP)
VGRDRLRRSRREIIDWTGKEWSRDPEKLVAHANARFTAPARQCPAIDPAWEDPNGVPISAFLFGGRRPTTIPLVHQAFSWNHGVFLGSIVGSEVTAAAISAKIGQVRRDPFAMLPFCGYNMGDYFQHWINIGKKGPADKRSRRCIYVHWFRKTAGGKWLWPGYGEKQPGAQVGHSSVCPVKAGPRITAIGFKPTIDASTEAAS